MFYSKTTNSFYDPTINTSIPPDAVEISKEDYDALQLKAAQGLFIVPGKDGFPVNGQPYEPSKTEKIVTYEAAAQQNLDLTAQSWGYANMVTAVSYANSTNIQYAADATALIQWRDSYWDEAYIIEAGTLPTTAEAFVALLPKPPTKPTV